MFKKIAIVVVVLIAGVLLFAATKPDTFRVERSASINAPPEKVQEQITDFRKWTAWSPWEKLDPAMKRTYSGAASGTGAVYEWTGDSNVGAGRMEILSASPAETKVKLDFLSPMASSNTTIFATRADGAATNLVWSMEGGMPYMQKLMSVFVSMDSLIGKDFEAGLANLKATAEKESGS